MLTPEQIRNMRRRLGLNQEAFGRALGVTRDAVASWEIGRSRPQAIGATLAAVNKRMNERPDNLEDLGKLVKYAAIGGGTYMLLAWLFGKPHTGR